MYHLSDQSFLQTDTEPFASGGEGNLFHIADEKSDKGSVAKIYHPNKRTTEREAKINYMCSHQPDFQKFGHSAAIWVSEVVYDSGKFAGFVMPYAKGIKLEYLCGNKIPNFLGDEWKKYDLQYKDAFYLRLKLCFNIAVAISQIHATGQYVLTDLKPDNIIINSAGLVSIVDIDSFQVAIGGKVLFPATAQTPEYSPSSDKNFTQEWDRFSMAVIFYRLLFGIHPFTGSCHAPYDNCHSIEEMIKNNLFPHLESKKEHFKIIPPPHLKFARLDTQTRTLFMQAFGNEQRPSAETWAQALYVYSKMNVTVQINQETKPVVDTKRKKSKYVDFEKAKKLYINPIAYWKEKTSKVSDIIFHGIVEFGSILIIPVIIFVGFLFSWTKSYFNSLKLETAQVENLPSLSKVDTPWEKTIQLYFDKKTHKYIIKNTLDSANIANYDDVTFIENQKFAKVWQGDKLGFIDETGREVAPCIYNGFEPLIGVTNEQGKYGFINMDGQLVVDYKYDDVSTFKDIYANYITVWCGEKTGLVNKNGKEIMPCK